MTPVRAEPSVSTDLLAALVDHGAPAVVVDGGGTCRLANPAAVALTGEPGRAMTGHRIADRIALFGEPAVTDALASARHGREATVEASLPGTGRRFVVRAVPAGEHVLVLLEETTERRAAERAAEAATERARLSGLAGGTGSYSSDLTASTIWLSEQARRLIGFEPVADSTYPRARVVEAVVPQDRAGYLAGVAAATANPGAVYDVTYRVVRHDDGAVRTLHAVGEVLRDAEGRPATLVGAVSDVTDRSAAADALRISEDRLRRTVEGVDAIISFREDAEAEVLHSPQIERILGYRPEALTDNDAWDALVHPDDLPTCLAAWQGPGREWHLTYRMRRADGAWVWVDDRGRWIERSDGRGRGLIGVITDATDRMRVEQELRASEDRLRRTVEGVDAVITYLEADGELTIQSPQVERMLGYRPEALTSEDAWFELIHPDDLERCLATWRAQTPTWQLTYRMRRADGHWIWVDDRGQRFSHADGRGSGYVGVLTDATDRVEAGQARRMADERRRRFFDANIVGTLVAEASGRVLEANDYWLRLVGRERAELDRGEVDWRALTAPESLADDDESIAQCRATGTSHPYEKAYLRPDGTRTPVLVVHASMPGPGEQIATFVLDLTEQKAAAAEMAELVAAIEQTAEAVLVTDASATIRYVNPAFERVSGYTREEAVGQNPRMLHSGVHPPEYYRDMWATLTDGRTWHGELTNRRKDGTLFTEVAAISPVRDALGRVTAYVGVKRDVTAERELEARLSQAQRLEAIGQLAGGIAHDFNNLLAVIRGYADLARASMAPSGPATDDLDQVILAADRASSLTRQLLQFGRRQAMEPRVLEAAGVVENLAPMLRRLLGEHIELEVVTSPAAGTVRVDPGQLEQVVVNLAANGRDAMPDGGRLTIATGPAEDADGAWVRITVSDTGVGMDAATTERVFEPFFTTKDPGRGTGLGLSTVYGIVTQSGGRISVASSRGRGSTFTIDLPRVALATRADHAEPEPVVLSPVRALTVLLVEDDPAVRGLTSRLLTGLGHSVVDASSGAEALGLVEVAERMPDLLLTDIRMPGIQGPELARRLRDRRPDLPVVFMSGFSADVEVSAVLPGAGMLDKPFDRARLEAAIGAAIGPQA
jgi:two-component system cell cycle sensor histidine kinase/response regulator CckA